MDHVMSSSRVYDNVECRRVGQKGIVIDGDACHESRAGVDAMMLTPVAYECGDVGTVVCVPVGVVAGTEVGGLGETVCC